MAGLRIALRWVWNCWWGVTTIIFSLWKNCGSTRFLYFVRRKVLKKPPLSMGEGGWLHQSKHCTVSRLVDWNEGMTSLVCVCRLLETHILIIAAAVWKINRHLVHRIFFNCWPSHRRCSNRWIVACWQTPAHRIISCWPNSVAIVLRLHNKWVYFCLLMAAIDQLTKYYSAEVSTCIQQYIPSIFCCGLGFLFTWWPRHRQRHRLLSKTRCICHIHRSLYELTF